MVFIRYIKIDQTVFVLANNVNTLFLRNAIISLRTAVRDGRL